MKILKVLGILLLAFILFMVIFVATRPDTFHIERSARINAAPAVVFSLINDFHEWTKWSPWERMDPELKRTYDGPTSGVGTKYAWASEKVGEGRMTILESKPNEAVVIKLEFIKPFAATNQAAFKLEPADGGTRVTWSMDGKNNTMGKAFSLFMSMDTMVGRDFEQGLFLMNKAAEMQSKEPASKKE